MTNKTSKKTLKLSDDDIQFVSYSLDEHFKLLNSHHGCSWENTLVREKERAKRTIKALKVLTWEYRKGEKPTATADDFFFLQFCMCEWCDFLSEGVGTPWSADLVADTSRANRMLDRIRRMIGLSKAAAVAGPPMNYYN